MQDELQHLSDIEHIRRRPAMYFGDLDAATVANCLAREAYCLAIDQILAKTCTRLTSDFTVDGFAAVAHNGMPLGVDPESQYGDRSEMLCVAEIMRFCAHRAANDYVHENICKSGIIVLNALCERFELHNFRDGNHYLLAYDRGVRESELQHIGSTEQSGVTVRFKPDSAIFRHTEFDAEELQTWFASLPIDASGVDIVWNDQRSC